MKRPQIFQASRALGALAQQLAALGVGHTFAGFPGLRFSGGGKQTPAALRGLRYFGSHLP